MKNKKSMKSTKNRMLEKKLFDLICECFPEPNRVMDQIRMAGALTLSRLEARKLRMRFRHMMYALFEGRRDILPKPILEEEWKEYWAEILDGTGHDLTNFFEWDSDEIEDVYLKGLVCGIFGTVRTIEERMVWKEGR